MSGSEPWQRDFERHRGHLWAVAYRILGTVSDADDAVQETWLRWRRSDHGSVTDQRGYLTTIVSRICYDLLASARARRETYVGEWLPEPVITDQDGPDDRVVMDESVSVALLAVMERLTPAERIAFVLHDVFAVPFDEIAAIVERTPDAVRQLASRARRRLREYAPRRSMDWAAHRKAVEAFIAAATSGDLPALVAVLDPDVVWRADGGGVVPAVRVPIRGAERVSRLVLNLIARWCAMTGTSIQVRTVNGRPGMVLLEPSGAVNSVAAFTVADGRITEVDAILNPDKLRHLSV